MKAAKTPEEQSALMAEHKQTMQDGMTMMNGMLAPAKLRAVVSAVRVGKGPNGVSVSP